MIRLLLAEARPRLTHKNENLSPMLLTIVLICIKISNMYVCVCKGITDSQIREAVADGATSLRGVRSRLGVASQCGNCARCAKDVIDECLSSSRSESTFAGCAVVAFAAPAKDL